jgi:hypothetical protein
MMAERDITLCHTTILRWVQTTNQKATTAPGIWTAVLAASIYKPLARQKHTLNKICTRTSCAKLPRRSENAGLCEPDV